MSALQSTMLHALSVSGVLLTFSIPVSLFNKGNIADFLVLVILLSHFVKLNGTTDDSCSIALLRLTSRSPWDSLHKVSLGQLPIRFYCLGNPMLLILDRRFVQRCKHPDFKSLVTCLTLWL